jgi:hypothetical protein
MVMPDRDDLDLTCINTSHTLSMDAVQAANDRVWSRGADDPGQVTFSKV